MKIKIFGALAILILGGIAYTVIKSNSNQSPSGAPNNAGGPNQTENQEQNLANTKLLYAKKTSTTGNPNKSVIELYTFDLKTDEQKLVFTDVDEDFRTRLIDGIFNNNVLIFGTPLNESAGSIWQISLDGSGTKKQIVNQFSASAFCSNGVKTVYITYDNVKGSYNLMIEDFDGRFKTKVTESETVLSDPIIMDTILGFVKIDKDGNGSVNTINFNGSGIKEIFKAKNQLIFDLNFASNKFVYAKKPKSGTSGSADIFVYDTGTNKEKQITNDKDADSFPILSKDGLKIAFAKNGKIWFGNFDGTNLKAVVDGYQPIGFIE